MAFKHKLMKSKWYPRPHSMKHRWGHSLDTAAVNDFTIYPIAMYDEGLGAPSTYEANPEHASFVEAAEPNCFPESRIDNIFCQLTLNMGKPCITDSIRAVKVCYMPIFTAFPTDYTAIDNLSTLEIQDILELQMETTDRQGFPLYNAVDMIAPFTGSTTLATNVPGLT